MAEAMIEVNKLSKLYLSGALFKKSKPAVRALDDVSIRLEKGKILGIVGESGSGKTTLANVILKLTNATSGNVRINGIDIAHADRREMKQLRRSIAVVFQDPMANLNPRFTVAKSIMRPMIVQNVPRQEALRRAEEVMDMVKMDRMYLDSYPKNLSGGQLQRIAIARALVLHPKIMILDEPTSALDISIQAQVLNMLLNIQRQLDLTYVIISHDLNIVRYISDYIAVMYLGKLMEYGSAEDVFFQPKHPYTKGLMAATPITDPALRSDRPLLFSGEPSSVMNIEEGCRLAPRCPYAEECCRKKTPDLYNLGGEHYVACYRESFLAK